ncbi:DUF4126 domain-containing protein [Gulosibacter sp. ACHW.36C]|uniref:DUF4126 domain-containing protein n=1 Tax=Gulosibacter sediminis TaxID=1729695 RepID=A0ABY4MTL0_9MICO|nr:DUF4126 domain-containing protein [Gulosibacter sediminis]UQN13761.1 DUF4126 domain-containing protein [Gulosibacter sediminis]
MLELLTGTGLAAAAGLGAFLPMLIIGLLDRFTDLVALPAGWDWLSSDIALIVVGVLTVLDIVADKIPAIDTVNDIVQTVVRPASGGIVFGAGTSAQTVTLDEPSQFFSAHVWVAISLGAIIALVTHLAKASTRAAVNAVTVGAAAPLLSTGEDAMSFGLVASAVLAPVLVLVLLAGLFIMAAALTRRLRGMLARRKARAAEAAD